jgi:4-hydroxythreonine-4-phosphate dehydrogenase
MDIDNRPVIALTIGDPAGIGPEVVIKSLFSKQTYDICRPLVIGEAGVLATMIKILDARLEMNKITSPAGVIGQFGTIDLLDLHNIKPEELDFGVISKACGRAAMEYVSTAAELVTTSKVSAMVTAPINKEATVLAGYGDIGHLEYLARVTGATQYAGMLVSGQLRVVHLTTHYSLKDSCKMVKRERILARLKLIHDVFRQWGIVHPRLGVAALNPHGGDGGLFGKEEIDEILPAVAEARNLGIDARGSFPADSVFNRAISGEFDVVLAMYHDQGHIAIKVHGFEESIGVSLGLPLIRTSVDHGTAFDIAGKGIASGKSMVAAIKMAVDLIEGKLT